MIELVFVLDTTTTTMNYKIKINIISSLSSNLNEIIKLSGWRGG